MDEWIKKRRSKMCCLQETHFHLKDTNRLRVKGWKKDISSSGNQKKAGVDSLYCFHQTKQTKLKMVKRDKEGHYTMIQGSIHQKDVTIYESNITAPKYIRQKLTELKRKINGIVTINNNS